MMVELKDDLERLIPPSAELEIRQIPYYREKKEVVWKEREWGKWVNCRRTWVDYYMREEDTQVLFLEKISLPDRLIHALKFLGISEEEAEESLSFWNIAREEGTLEPAELEIYHRLRRFADSLFIQVVLIEVGEKQEGMRKLEYAEEEKLLDLISDGGLFFIEKNGG